MLDYDLVKWIHIVSVTVLFATGLATAAHMWITHKRGNVRAIASMTRKVVRVDLAFTAPSLLVLPVTGAILMGMVGISPGVPWLVTSYILYAIVFGCWVPAIRLRMRLRDITAAASRRGEALPDCYYRYMRWWLQLSWPAFVALLVVLYLMVSQPEAAAPGANGIPAL